MMSSGNGNCAVLTKLGERQNRQKATKDHKRKEKQKRERNNTWKTYISMGRPVDLGIQGSDGETVHVKMFRRRREGRRVVSVRVGNAVRDPPLVHHATFLLLMLRIAAAAAGHEEEEEDDDDDETNRNNRTKH
jgi:hypothetical protein